MQRACLIGLHLLQDHDYLEGAHHQCTGQAGLCFKPAHCAQQSLSRSSTGEQSEVVGKYSRHVICV